MAKRNLKDIYPPHTIVTPQKYSDGNGGTITVLPSPVVRKNLTDYAYGKDIDEKVIVLAVALAEKMAINIIRESQLSHVTQLEALVDQITNQLTTKLIDKMPTQQVIIQQTAQEALPEFKKKVKDFEFDTSVQPVNRKGDMVLKGQGTKNTKTNDTTDDTLDALDKLNL